MRKNIKEKYITLIILLAVFIGAAVLLNRPDQVGVLSSAQKRTFAAAKVTDILSDNAAPDRWTEGRRIGEQKIEITVLTGLHKGAVLETVNYLNAYYNIDAKVGTRIIVRLDYNDAGELYVVSIPNYDRSRVLIATVLVFAVFLILAGGKKGAAALFILLFTLVNLWFILIPLILKGVPPILAALLICSCTSAGALLVVMGYTKKTLCAILGCVGGLLTAGGFAWMVTILTPINGFNMPEAEDMVLRASDTPLKISGLLISTIMLSALGALMSTSLSVVSVMYEAYEKNPFLTRKQIFRSGMNIGRETMGTMANILILAFAGSSLNLFLLFQIYDYPAIQILNSDMVVIEILQGVAGSVGIIAVTPILSALCAAVLHFGRNKNSKSRLKLKAK